MSNNIKKDGKLRWLDPTQFKDSWHERVVLLYGLIEACNLPTKNMSFTEYGCGPKSPFSKLYGDKFKENIRYDIKKWDDGVSVVDLNESGFRVAKTDIGIVSGVLEYLNDLDYFFRKMSIYHEYILFSYMVRPSYYQLEQGKTFDEGLAKYVSCLKQRSVENGNRNHYDLDGIMSISSLFGYIEDIGLWRNQVLVLMKHK